MPSVSVSRTIEHRIAQMTLADGAVRHVPADGHGSTFTEGTTLCGLAYGVYDGHEYLGHYPLTDIDCATCVAAALLIPFRHATTWSRYRRGSGAVRGQGARYGTSWSCTCGERGQVNSAPSAGGKKWVDEDAAAHLAQIAEQAGVAAS